MYSSHDEQDDRAMTVLLTAAEFRNHTWGDWYIIVKPRDATASLKYTITYHLQGLYSQGTY